MDTVAVLLSSPERIALHRLDLSPAGEADVVVDVDFSGISTGTERLLWSGAMPAFPGMGYPLVPGYESVGRVVEAGPLSGRRVGESVFVGGARCFGPVRSLFGGSAARLVLPGERAVPVPEGLGEKGVLLALAATAQHALAGGLPDLIVGHGVLGRLLARLVVLAGGSPTVWERDAARQAGAAGYAVMHPDEDPRRDYARIHDVSGDAAALDGLIARLRPEGEVVLAGFYAKPLQFSFAPAFMREARLRVAAEWKPADLASATALVASGRLSLEGLVTHRRAAADTGDAYRTAFGDAACLKMVLDWRDAA
ncbi:chlorophyll synthesis pathway protein BchC [Roseomonas nepalensis]|uniref:Chlorophyll synthesis pathway protein BchC n=1 Tax=Muricoccus nepalensis TaxID=1854500 RepID=A0A502GC07_9PROT|nr:chlorophyll synthesis pathway protein BchC [Roseomonas nepalensis]TPG58566.1 chlorophyll synthesis pathway protein BchC [Roseomonas nepalensis]